MFHLILKIYPIKFVINFEYKFQKLEMKDINMI